MRLSGIPRWTRLYLRLDASSVGRIERGAAILIVGALILTFAAHSATWIPSSIRRQITLAAENNLAAWFGSILLFSVGLVGLLCAGVERQADASGARGRRGSGTTVIAWTAIALGFFALSLDEMGSIHERLAEQQILRLVLPELGIFAGWTAVFALPMALAAGTLLWVGWRWLGEVPGVWPLLAVGVLMFLTVPVQEHFEASRGVVNQHAIFSDRSAWAIVLEEGAELLASLCFLSAGLRFSEHRSRDIRRLDGKFGLEIGWGPLFAMVAVYVVLFGAVQLSAPDLPRAGNARGVPSNWFPATAAFLGLLLALHLAAAERSRIGTPTGSPQALRALAGVNLALSVGYAANFPVYDLLDSRPALQSGWVFAVGASVLVTGMFASRISSSGVVGAGLLAWTAGFLLRPFVEPRSWAPLSLLSQAALLTALVAILVDRARQTWIVKEGASGDTHVSIRSGRKTA